MTYFQEASLAIEDPNRDEAACPRCEQRAATYVVDDTLTYGSGEDAVELRVRVPVRHCETCDIDFLDYVGERIRTEAVYRHKSLLTPWEIRAIRERHQLSRTAFAEITGLGEATIKRWESGATAQNRANDRYLRLLNERTCWSTLERLAGPKREDRSDRVLVAGPWRKLHEVPEQLRRDQGAFSPRSRDEAA